MLRKHMLIYPVFCMCVTNIHVIRGRAASQDGRA